MDGVVSGDAAPGGGADRAAVPTTDATAAPRCGPQAAPQPPVTSRSTTIGRRSRSLPSLSGGASGCSRKVNGTVKLSSKGTEKRRGSLEPQTYAAALAPVTSAHIANACARTARYSAAGR